MKVFRKAVLSLLAAALLLSCAGMAAAVPTYKGASWVSFDVGPNGGFDGHQEGLGNVYWTGTTQAVNFYSVSSDNSSWSTSMYINVTSFDSSGPMATGITVARPGWIGFVDPAGPTRKRISVGGGYMEWQAASTNNPAAFVSVPGLMSAACDGGMPSSHDVAWYFDENSGIDEYVVLSSLDINYVAQGKPDGQRLEFIVTSPDTTLTFTPGSLDVYNVVVSYDPAVYSLPTSFDFEFEVGSAPIATGLLDGTEIPSSGIYVYFDDNTMTLSGDTTASVGTTYTYTLYARAIIVKEPSCEVTVQGVGPTTGKYPLGTFTLQVGAGGGGAPVASADVELLDASGSVLASGAGVSLVSGATPTASSDLTISADVIGALLTFTISNDFGTSNSGTSTGPVSIDVTTATGTATGLVATFDPATKKVSLSGTAPTVTVATTYNICVTMTGATDTRSIVIPITVTPAGSVIGGASFDLNPQIVTVLVPAGPYSGNVTVTSALTLTSLTTDITEFAGLTITPNFSTGQISISGTPVSAYPSRTVVTVTGQDSAGVVYTGKFILQVIIDPSKMFDPDYIKLFNETTGREDEYTGYNLYSGHRYKVFFWGDVLMTTPLTVEVMGPRDVSYKTLTKSTDYWTTDDVQWVDWGITLDNNLAVNLPTTEQGYLYPGTYNVRLTYYVDGVAGGPYTQVMTFTTSSYSESGEGGDGSSGGCNAGLGAAALAVCALAFLRKRS